MLESKPFNFDHSIVLIKSICSLIQSRGPINSYSLHGNCKHFELGPQTSGAVRAWLIVGRRRFTEFEHRKEHRVRPLVKIKRKAIVKNSWYWQNHDHSWHNYGIFCRRQKAYTSLQLWFCFSIKCKVIALLVSPKTLSIVNKQLPIKENVFFSDQTWREQSECIWICVAMMYFVHCKNYPSGPTRVTNFLGNFY